MDGLLVHKTRRAILDLLKRRGSASVEALARELALIPVTARPHLRVLEEEGLISGTDVRGQRGRPYRVYRLTPRAEEQYFPKQYDTLALQLLSTLAEKEGHESLQVLMDHVAENMAAPQRARVEGKPFAPRVAEVARILAETGGTAELQPTADGYVVREYNCPYLQVSRQSAQVCEIDRRLVSKLAGAPVQLDSDRLRDGAARCSFVISDRPGTVEPDLPAAVST